MALIGKNCKVFYDDAGNIKPRVGIIVDETAGFITIKNSLGTDAIPNCKIIRIEVLP